MKHRSIETSTHRDMHPSTHMDTRVPIRMSALMLTHRDEANNGFLTMFAKSTY